MFCQILSHMLQYNGSICTYPKLWGRKSECSACMGGQRPSLASGEYQKPPLPSKWSIPTWRNTAELRWKHIGCHRGFLLLHGCFPSDGQWGTPCTIQWGPNRCAEWFFLWWWTSASWIRRRGHNTKLSQLRCYAQAQFAWEEIYSSTSFLRHYLLTKLFINTNTFLWVWWFICTVMNVSILNHQLQQLLCP